MSACYRLEPVDAPQTRADETFIGGKPRLPAAEAIPVCKLCGAEQTFFFQIAFPEKNEWAGLSLATFACTSCADKDKLIPQMLPGPLPGIDIPEGFLEAYQVNFRFLVFPTAEAVLREDYREKVAYQLWKLEPSSPRTRGTKVGGTPDWLQEDESPRSYAGRTPMFFLMQIEKDVVFQTVPDAPPQIKIGLSGKPQPASYRHYKLFISNATYLFGTEDRERPLVYAITQVA